jgi:hypothetical protein
MHDDEPTVLLNDDDQLSLSLGRMVRAHSLLEHRLRNVRLALDAPGQPAANTYAFVGADELAKACATRLRDVDTTAELLLAGEQSLEAAREANMHRNNMVHDLWLLAADGDESRAAQWHLFGPTLKDRVGGTARSETSDAQSVDGVRVELVRAAHRLSGLFMALHEVLPRYQDEPRRSGWTSNMTTYLALMNDQFDLDHEDNWVVPPSH